MAAIKLLNLIEINFEILDEMLNYTHNFIMRLLKIRVVHLVIRILDKLKECITEMEHAIHYALCIRILDIRIVNTDKISNVLQFILSPRHNRMNSHIVLLGGHSIVYGEINSWSSAMTSSLPTSFSSSLCSSMLCPPFTAKPQTA